MSRDPGDSTRIRNWIERLHRGDRRALDELIGYFHGRFRQLASTVLADFPGVADKEGTDDILQRTYLRLCGALEKCSPASSKELFHLASRQIRWELLNLAEYYRGRPAVPLEPGNRPWSGPEPFAPRAESTWGPVHRAIWAENQVALSRAVEALPEEVRDVFVLIWYGGLTTAEVADASDLSERVVKYRQRKAELAISRSLKGHADRPLRKLARITYRFPGLLGRMV